MRDSGLPFGGRPGKCHTHYNLKLHDPVWFKGEASFEEGFLPCGFYEFAGDGFVIEGGHNVSIKVILWVILFCHRGCTELSEWLRPRLGVLTLR